MQAATDQTVLGDFANVEFTHFDITTAFFRHDGRFWVRANNAEGDLQDFEVKYTFGVAPLQQYLVELPGGRLQVLPTAWDTRSREEGGQRWFHVYGNEYIGHTDLLHWTGREQNWNNMCAECHSTGLEKNYSHSTNTFDTTWAEINVACEACHGPGSQHAERPEVALSVDLHDAGSSVWQMNAATGIAQRSEPPNDLLAQPEACGRCHSRRANIAANYEFGRPLTDTHLPSLLDEQLYYPDGQILDEVYVYGSFLQSKMYRAGVTCSDCHDPHTGRLKTAGEASNICSGCHLPSIFASSGHHRHAPDEAACVDCHMPSRNYMVIDSRRDHSFRVPRPDLTIKTGSPNACNQCHSHEDADSMANAVNTWYGKTSAEPAHFAETIHAGRLGSPGANAQLLEVIDDDANPAIARATALTLLAMPFVDEVAAVVRRELSSRDPLIRIAALRSLEDMAPAYRAEWAVSSLTDPIRAVRTQAVTTLSRARAALRQADRERLEMAEREYIRGQLALAERPESHINLGNLYADSGDAAKAEASYLLALQMEPRAVAARVNLVDLYRQLERDSDSERILRDGIALDDVSAALHHALGLLLVRDGKPDDALTELALAARLDAQNARYIYVYAVALNSLGESERAISTLEDAREKFPANYDIAWALATMYRDIGRVADARVEANRLLAAYPDDPRIRSLIESL